MSLRWRIALALAAIAGVVGALAAVGAYVTTARGLESSVDDTLLVRGRDMARPGPVRTRPGAGMLPRDECPPDVLLRPVSAAQLVTADGEVVECLPGSVVLPVDGADVAVAERQGATHLRTVVVGGDDYRVLTISWGDGTALQLARDLGEVSSVLAGLRVRLALIVTAAVAVAAALGWLVARRVVRPVVQLRDATESIAATQDLSTTVPTDGPGEVGDLAQSFNTMVGALAVSREQQQRLVTDASHEMRTPLTSLRTNLELLQRLEEMDESDRRRALGAVVADVGELTHLLTELVELSTDPTREDEAVEAVALAELAEAVAGRARRRSGRAIEVLAGPSTPLVEVRPQMVERAIANLVENALKYSPAGTAVEVRVGVGQVEVRDHGPGIPEADLPHVFDRFFRSVTARTEPGSGLGLSIVAQIAARHGGRAWASNDPGGGAVVGFSVGPPPPPARHGEA